MADFRDKHASGVPAKAKRTSSQTVLGTGIQKRRGKRVNSRVPVAVEWASSGECRRGEFQTRVVGPYGCLVVSSQSIDVQQHIQLTNLVSNQSNLAVIVWCGKERSEGWELGVELINPQMDFWGLEL